ncbi:MBL fold metallo-hydrolase [Dyadobacter arcticus]|uniref:Glyoxylase-like metal-dependent hydrolase (Beta-lactamase superfamily II) n=1 Tax=Dyadobacter arcticus TaxID=1078754 RepID=A0ABX0UQ67_9BACT|nr:MBL fold metallo-hydrolase [Dyadobacter arcticus]NIJ54099.1 glyoxylase-like metal-dependent hydrolase (beta-lactamase superfamily II) [Dyadobacter arcticus]
MKQVSEHVYQISLGEVNAFVIEDNGLTLVDTGSKNSKDKIFSAIKRAGKNPDDINKIILTNAHPDHSGSAADIKGTLGIPIYAHSEDAALVEKGIGGRLPHHPSPGIINWIIYNALIKRSPNETEPCTIAYRISDNDILPIAGGIQVIHTPGHSKGHVALLVKSDSVLIAGDICANLIGLDYCTIYEDRQLGIKSVLKAADFEFDIAVFGHGSPLKGSANAKLKQKFANL